jgi:4-hydroxy-tetrahydrodipicolinate reductase
MGSAIVRLASESDAFAIVARASEGDDLAALARAGAECAIDFSTPTATEAFAPLAAAAKLPLVVGTTGLSPSAERALEVAAQETAVFVASNMSVGVYVLGELVRRAAAMLGQSFDIEISEAHHKRKADAPSGTALTLLEIAKEGVANANPVFGRSGRPGARPGGEIGVHAVRGGDVIGDHHVHFLGEGERLELTHRATNRDVFARGALRAAGWLVGKPAGSYSMADLFR